MFRLEIVQIGNVQISTLETFRLEMFWLEMFGLEVFRLKTRLDWKCQKWYIVRWPRRAIPFFQSQHFQSCHFQSEHYRSHSQTAVAICYSGKEIRVLMVVKRSAITILSIVMVGIIWQAADSESHCLPTSFLWDEVIKEYFSVQRESLYLFELMFTEYPCIFGAFLCSSWHFLYFILG